MCRFVRCLPAVALMVGFALSAAGQVRRNAEPQNPPLQKALRLNREVIELFRQRKFREAIGKAERALPLFEKALGANHPEYVQNLLNLAGLHYAAGEYDRGVELYRDALANREEAVGKTHPHYRAVLLNLVEALDRRAEAAIERQEFAAAQKDRREVVSFRTTVHGESHWRTTDARWSLRHAEVLARLTADQRQRLKDAEAQHAEATALYRQGDYGRAIPLANRARQTLAEILSPEHPYLLASVNNLALMYKTTGDHSRAEPLYQTVLAHRERSLGESHPHYALSLNNLAALYKATSDYEKAAPLYERALAVRQRELGADDPLYAQSLGNLAALYREMGRYREASPLFEQAQEAYRRTLGERHHEYATCVNNRALLHDAMGDYQKAEALYRQALEIVAASLDDQHPKYAATLNSLAAVYWMTGAHDRAEASLRQALGIAGRNVELASAGQSERQQLAMLRQMRVFLDTYLSLTSEANASAETIYGHWLAWKGSVFSRQRWLRLQRTLPELEPQFARLDEVSANLASLAFDTPEEKHQQARRRLIAELTEEKEGLETELANRSATFGRETQARRLTVAQLRDALPRDVPLIDFLEYTHHSPSRRSPATGPGTWRQERRLLACVVSNEKQIVRVDLGPLLPIEKAIERWRRRFGAAGDGSTSPGAELRRLIWRPVTEHVAGAKTVLVSPTGALAEFPFAALPGDSPGSYLIEERAIVVIPSPQLLPELLEAHVEAPQSSLLLVGGIDFDAPTTGDEAEASRSAPRRDLKEWAFLEGTESEVATLAAIFRRRHAKAPITELRRRAPTESAVRQQAPRHRYVHLATHGFFAPAELRSALATVSSGPNSGADVFSREDIAGFHPGLLSGIVLAGANRPVEADRSDGIVTALEVAEFDLSRVELATLSACETGLGESAGGEGLLGLQRAFQVAGAKSTLASLWKVPDLATSLLMQRFYENLWQRGQSKSGALRDAQLWMLRDGYEELVKTAEEQNRGLEFFDDQQPHTKSKRLPPYYWAAFVLSGAWR